MSWLFASGGQSIGASASVFPVNIQGWFPLGLTGLIFSKSKGLSKSLHQHHSSKAVIFCHSASFMVWFSHPYMTIGKSIALTIWIFVHKMMSLLFNMLSRFVIAFLPRSKHLLFSWLQSPTAVILEPKKIKSATESKLFPSTLCHPWEKCLFIYIYILKISSPVASVLCSLCIKYSFLGPQVDSLGMGPGHLCVKKPSWRLW